MTPPIAHPKPRRNTPSPTFIPRPPEWATPTWALPTPTNTPPPGAGGTCLSIPELAHHDAQFGASNTLGRALDALRVDAVLALEKHEEGEFLLSARPWDGTAKQECAQLWAELDRPEPVPQRIAPLVPPSVLSYLTPPSSPEPHCKYDNTPVGPGSCVDESTALDDIPALDLDRNLEPGPPTDEPIAGESLDYLSDCDEFDWSYDDGDEEDEEDEVVQRPLSPPPPYPHYPDPRQLVSFPKNVADITTALDLASFSEWPVARGGFGDVWKGALVEGHDTKGRIGAKKKKSIAVKRLTMYADAGQEGAKKTMKRTARELSIWSRLHHANVLPLLGTCSFRGGVGIASEWQDNGNATAWVNTNTGANRLELCKGVCAGLEYLHRSNVIHGDLRGANVLISPSGEPRLIDFGLASIVGPNPAFSVSTTMAGTVRWMAPELQVTEGQSTTAASDMFAFGMTMLELHTGLPPFTTVKNDIAVLLKYQRGERPSRPTPSITAHGPKRRSKTRGDVCVSMDDETWDLVQECWAQDARDRPCARKVLEWLTRKTRLK